MKTKHGFEDANPDEPSEQLWETRKKDAKALLLIQQDLDEEVFSRIITAGASKEAWEILKQEYLGDKKVIIAELPTLHRDFKMLAMKNNESVQTYLFRVSGIVNRMKSCGENVRGETIVTKVLRSLTLKFDYVVAAIEDSKDLSSYSVDALMSSFLAHEDRLSSSSEKIEEKPFQVKGASSIKPKAESSEGQGQGRGDYHGRGSGRGRGQFGDQ